MAGEAAGAARAALAATLSNGSAVKTLSDAHAESAQAWAVTLREPLGVSVEMRATRPASADTARGGPQAWSLAISSPALDPATLARHAPRLNERLRARALAPMHLRIDGDDDVPA